MSFLEGLFPKKTLADVRGPVRVSIRARVHSTNSITSPLSGASAALILWRFSVRFMEVPNPYLHSRYSGPKDEIYEPLFSYLLGREVHLSTPQGIVFVSSEDLEVVPAVADGRGVPVDCPLPPEVAHVMTMPGARNGVLYYDENTLRNGDKVRLKAFVAACSDSPRKTPSGGSHHDFEVRPDLGAVVIEDESLLG
jgi:hypothetical protein